MSSKQYSRALRFYSDVLGLALATLKQRVDQRSYTLSKLVNVILWLARKEIKKLNDNLILIDSTAFQNATTKPPKPGGHQGGQRDIEADGIGHAKRFGQARAHLIDNMVAEPIFLFHHPAFSYTCLQSARFGRASLVLAGDRLKNRLSRRGQKFKNIKEDW